MKPRSLTNTVAMLHSPRYCRPLKGFTVALRLLVVICSLAALSAEHTIAAGDSDVPPGILQFLQQHCTDCHSGQKTEGDFSIDNLTFQLDDAAIRRRWIHVYDRVAQREMPPPDSSVLNNADRQQLLDQLSPPLEAAELQLILKRGRGPARRLTRSEFQNNLRRILLLPQLDIRDRLPAERDAHGFTKVSALLDVSRVQLEAFLDAAEAALQQAVASRQPPPPAITQRFTGLDLFPELSTFGEREAMFFARDNRLVAIDGGMFSRMTPEQRRDPSLELALFRSATWPYYGYPRGFLAKESGAYRLRFAGRAVRQVRDFRLAVALEPAPLSFRARQPSGPDVSGDVRETGGWMDLQPELREFETTIQLRAGETFEYSPLGLPVPFIRTDGGFFYDYPPMPAEGHRGVAIRWLEVTGPLREPDWPGASHRVLFDDVAIEKATAAEAERLFRRFAAIATLRPLTDASHAPFLSLIRQKLAAGTPPATALLAAFQAFLCSPHCLYLTEPRPGEPDQHFAIASRLSHFLWNQRPDERLFQLAATGQLRDPDALRSETSRLLADPMFSHFIQGFADEWLDLRRLRRDLPDERLYPEYRRDDYLVDSMELETRTFLGTLFTENLPVATTIHADFTFVNDRLARHYDLPRVSGSKLQRISLPPDSPFGGLLTQAAILKHTANGTSTSPVLRGAWVMEKLFGQPPGAPPKNIPSVEPDIRGAQSIRDLLNKHTAAPECARCHAKFDHVGFALENFDVMGAWRDRYRGLERGEKVTGIDPAGHPYTYFVGSEVDASGTLPSGESFQDIQQLRKLLIAQPRQLARNLLHQLILYSTGTPVSFADRREVELMLDAAATDGYRAGDLLHAVVQSSLFLGRGE